MITIAEPIEADALRIRHEFLELPGLQLTIVQAARLLGVSPAHASAMLEELEREGFLSGTANGVYRLAQPLLA